MCFLILLFAQAFVKIATVTGLTKKSCGIHCTSVFPFPSPYVFHGPQLCPEFLLLPLEQGEQSLNDHTRLIIANNTTSCPDDMLCRFYNTSMNTICRALLSEVGPWCNFATYVEWTLVRQGSLFIVSAEEDLVSVPPNPETQTSPTTGSGC